MDRPETLQKINRLIESVTALRDHCLAYEKDHAEDIAAVVPEYRRSARNLLHYLALRQHDLRELQEELSSLGMSSLGRLEAHTMATLNAVLKTLHRLADRPAPEVDDADTPVDFTTGPAALQDHAARLLGPEPAKHPVRIMVTMPSQAATDPALMRDLMAAGMNLVRINCAHDGPQAWSAMVDNLRRAEKELGHSCRILADLAGPKLRTGPLAQADHVIKLRPRRNLKGDVITRSRIWLTPEAEPADPPFGATGQLRVRGDLLAHVEPGFTIDVEERRGRERVLTVTDVEGGSCWTVCDRTLYVEDGAELILRNEDGREVARGQVGSVPPVVQPLILNRGDTLILTREAEPGSPGLRNDNGEMIEPARISCTLEAVFRSVKPGAELWLDDGAIGGVVRNVTQDEIAVEITYAGPGGSKLRGEKGINLPDTVVDTPALSEKDLADLDAVFPVIDVASLSFVQHPDDILNLERRLDDLDAQHLGVVLKIENRAAFRQLPKLLLTALRSPPVGVMVARGDLAVEVGFDRLAEVQEEILWLCESAHVPVIWATQVLEDMAKTGMPSRAEVTDAAMSGRAECVMLNKGSYIVEAVKFLDGVLERMGDHQVKKSARLRRLSVSALKDGSP